MYKTFPYIQPDLTLHGICWDLFMTKCQLANANQDTFKLACKEESSCKRTGGPRCSCCTWTINSNIFGDIENTTQNCHFGITTRKLCHLMSLIMLSISFTPGASLAKIRALLTKYAFIIKNIRQSEIKFLYVYF